MSFLKKLAPVLDWLPYIAIAVLVFGLQLAQHKIDRLNSQVKSQAQAIDLAQTMLDNQKTALDQKDSVIRMQSAGVEALEAASKASRDTYNAAQNTATSYAANQNVLADRLMALSGPTEELEQCRAARELLEKELTE